MREFELKSQVGPSFGNNFNNRTVEKRNLLLNDRIYIFGSWHYVTASLGRVIILLDFIKRNTL